MNVAALSLHRENTFGVFLVVVIDQGGAWVPVVIGAVLLTSGVVILARPSSVAVQCSYRAVDARGTTPRHGSELATRTTGRVQFDGIVGVPGVVPGVTAVGGHTLFIV